MSNPVEFFVADRLAFEAWVRSDGLSVTPFDIWKAALASERAKNGIFPYEAMFRYGDRVRTKRGPNARAEWSGTVCGWYRPSSGRLGFAVESDHHARAVQIYPQDVLEPAQ